MASTIDDRGQIHHGNTRSGKIIRRWEGFECLRSVLAFLSAMRFHQDVNYGRRLRNPVSMNSEEDQLWTLSLGIKLHHY